MTNDAGTNREIVKQGFRAIVCGGRDFTDKASAFAWLDHYHSNSVPLALVIHGAQRGADTLADEWAIARRVSVMVIRADWEQYGLAAGPIRNAQMLNEGVPHFVIAMPGGRGTRNMIKQAERLRVPVLRPAKELVGIAGATGLQQACRNNDLAKGACSK
jgi:hypothetical protein